MMKVKDKNKNKNKNKNKDKKSWSSIVMFSLALLLNACGSSTEDSSQKTNALDPKMKDNIEAVFATTLDGKPMSVLEARQSFKIGESILVKGRIGGIRKPFSEHFSSLVLTDDSTETCERISGDGCPTPWDACCVGRDKLIAARLTVQIVDEKGRPFEMPLRDVKGLKELDSLRVQGKVAKGSDEKNLMINAQKIMRE
jgi:hypothetical protein